mmetsp:Transcript_9188/g.14502  ORF Transcript_9188/g.14502 Transcript_9188/m.14502 type:complete len:182 (-) Transcript_9188:5204-5749(-)
MASPLILDGKGHLLGRLASICAKELLNGKKIVILRCEEIVVSGGLQRKKSQILSRYKKRTNTNPKKGPFHMKSPSQFFWKAIRSMLPHKTKHGAEALSRLKVYNGIPGSYVSSKKMVVPEALRILRLKESRKFTKLGLLFGQIGWKYQKIIFEKKNTFTIASNKYFRDKKSIINSTHQKDN